ncbi:MAG: CDP-alcohol phosphatidyltransferase family protein [Pseudomonadota bacterium]
MFRSTSHIVAQRIESQTPITWFLGVSTVFAILLVFASLATFATAAVPLLVFAGTVVIGSYGLIQTYPHAVLGLCNTVTLFRAAAVAFLVGAVLFPPVSAWVVFCVALLAFALDGVDGWLARRANLVSVFGARFDMETDAGLGAVISVWLLTSGSAGPEILILGFMRYAFVAASLVWPALQSQLPEVFRRKAICVVQIATLILLVFPLTPQVVAAPVGIAAAILLSWSFFVDIVWLARRTA